jgi:hypothetical protein
MTASSPARIPAEFSHHEQMTSNGGADVPVQGPMSQQDAADCHGHDMHPQKFVRLVGCHESNGAQEDDRP